MSTFDAKIGFEITFVSSKLHLEVFTKVCDDNPTVCNEIHKIAEMFTKV